jgi:hypothetical protein
VDSFPDTGSVDEVPEVGDTVQFGPEPTYPFNLDFGNESSGVDTTDPEAPRGQAFAIDNTATTEFPETAFATDAAVENEPTTGSGFSEDDAPTYPFDLVSEAPTTWDEEAHTTSHGVDAVAEPGRAEVAS